MGKTAGLLAIIGLLALPALAEEYPVRGFPTGEEVLNKRAVPHEQPEPHLEYRKNGFNGSILSKVPPPGEHPRVVMSPEDVPRIRRNIKDNAFCKRVWERIIVAGLNDKKGELKPAEKADLPRAALYALIMDDQEYGKAVAEAAVKKAGEVDRKLDEIDRTHPYPQHWWFTVRGSGIFEVAAAYDYAYGFLDDTQRAAVRKVISQATVGRYNHGMELPRAWRTWNWPQFSQNIVNVALAIEGEEGYEPRILEVCRESVVDFLTYKISPEGWDFEATGYNGLAWGGGGVQSLHAVARHVTPNPLMHPHLQAQTAAYIGQQGGPEGPWFGRGDANGSAPQFELTHLMRAFYPDDPRWKMLWSVSRNQAGLGPNGGRIHLRGSMCIPMLLYAVPDEENYRDYWGTDKDYPVTYEAFSRGFMGTRTDWDPDNSVHMTFAVYKKLRDSGHDGPDAGTFSIWGHGVDWSRGGDKWHKFSSCRAYVAVDGGGMTYGTAPGLFMPVVEEPMATAARGDMTYSFSWHIANGRYNVLYSPMFKEDPSNYLNDWARNAVKKLRGFEPDPTLFSREFWRMASTNYGLWNGEDRHPTRRYVNLPMARAFRSATLVRGDASLNDGRGYPYVLTVDDIQQDDERHLYSWIMPLAGQSNELVRVTGEREERFTEIVVRRIPPRPKGVKDWPPPLKKGDPVLMVKVLQKNYNGFPGIRLENAEKGFMGMQRIVVPSISVAPDFKVLVYPHRHGDPTPITTWNPGKTSLTIEIGKQVDTIEFAGAYVDRRPFGGHGEETCFNLFRNGEKLITVGGPPSEPRFAEESRDFTGTMTVAFANGQPGESIRYTTDGSEPTPESTLYEGPFEISKTTTVRAITYSPNWDFGDKDSLAYKELVRENFIVNKPAEYRQIVSTINEKASPPASATYTKVQACEGELALGDAAPGVELKVYELPISIWRGSAVDMTSPLMPADLSKETPIFRTYQQNLSVPRVQPTVAEEKMYLGVYVFSGYFRAKTGGHHDFKMKSCGPTRLTVGGKRLIDVPGPYHVMLREREGEVHLQEGLHRFEAIFTDPSFFVSPKLPVIEFALSVQTPGMLTFAPIPNEDLFRDKDFGFSIADTILEVGRPLTLEHQKAGQLEVSTDGGKTFAVYRKPLVFDEVQSVPLAVRRPGGAVISKRLSIIKRIKAAEKVPSLARGMIRQRFLLPVKAEFDVHADHNPNAGSINIRYPRDPDQDMFAFTKTAKSEETVVCAEMLPDKTGGVVRQYTGYWWAPESGVYAFTLNNEGSNKLLIDDVHVSSNHNAGSRPEGRVILESGWHRFVVMFENSYPKLTMSGPAGERDMLVSDFFRPTGVKEVPFHADQAGKPVSFLLGSWFQPNKPRDDKRLKSEIFGAEPAGNAEHPGAHRFSGEQSMILLREISQTSEDFTLSMWIKPDELKRHEEQYLWNRQKTGWVYTQRGGIFLCIKGDQLCFGGHGRNRPARVGKLKAGEWYHVAVIIKSDAPKKRALMELWLNGEKIGSELHPHQLNVTTYYMELFAQVDRAKTELKRTATLSYDDVKKDDLIQKCFKGEAADVRMYDAALPAEAIRKLTGR
jgi:hypothetical protein